MKLVVGLGNPGAKYAGHRHNVGFWCVDALREAYEFGNWQRKFSGLVCKGKIGNEDAILLKPQTYMNESGRSVGPVMDFYKIAAGDVLVIHDELDLPVGTVKVKFGGGHAGHNGLKSLIQHLGTNDFGRVRVGIDHPGHKDLVSDYVLHDFGKDEVEQVVAALEPVLENFEEILTKEIHTPFNITPLNDAG